MSKNLKIVIANIAIITTIVIVTIFAVNAHKDQYAEIESLKN